VSEQEKTPPITLVYRNWRGEIGPRTIRPVRIWFGSTDWHPEPQWLVDADDAEKQAYRTFALDDFVEPWRHACRGLAKVAEQQQQRIAALEEMLRDIAENGMSGSDVARVAALLAKEKVEVPLPTWLDLS